MLDEKLLKRMHDFRETMNSQSKEGEAPPMFLVYVKSLDNIIPSRAPFRGDAAKALKDEKELQPGDQMFVMGAGLITRYSVIREANNNLIKIWREEAFNDPGSKGVSTAGALAGTAVRQR